MPMNNLDTFTRAYIECALWSSMDESDETGGRPMDENYTIDDLSPECLAKMLSDCDRFQSANSAMIISDLDRAGNDFWLTRNRHGAGFWDGDWKEPQATLLTDASHRFGETDLYVGDDGLIYCHP